jgi:hypothetical protein
MSIRFKVIVLILVLSIASFIGFGILIVNGQQVRRISHGLTGDYEDALARESFSKFNDFLNAIQASSGISQTLGETFYRLKDTLSRHINVTANVNTLMETSEVGRGGLQEMATIFNIK